MIVWRISNLLCRFPADAPVTDMLDAVGGSEAFVRWRTRLDDLLPGRILSSEGLADLGLDRVGNQASRFDIIDHPAVGYLLDGQPLN